MPDLFSTTALALFQKRLVDCGKVGIKKWQKKDAGEIPVQDKLELIKKILTEHKCICGACIKAGTQEYNAIMEAVTIPGLLTIYASAFA